VPKVFLFGAMMDRVPTKQKALNSDVYLHPQALFRDPFRDGEKTVLGETFNSDHKPGVANYRMPCPQDMKKGEVQVFRIC